MSRKLDRSFFTNFNTALPSLSVTSFFLPFLGLFSTEPVAQYFFFKTLYIIVLGMPKVRMSHLCRCCLRVSTRSFCKQMHTKTTNDTFHVMISNATTFYVITFRNLTVAFIAPIYNTYRKKLMCLI